MDIFISETSVTAFFLTIFGTRDEDQQEIDEDEEVFLQGETEIEA